MTDQSVRIPVVQIDAFTDRAFGGNPAAVCRLDEWLPETVMQAIATENNLSETAFVVDREDGSYDLRWFTPTIEVDLCGHATLAAGSLMLSEPGRVVFHTASGPLHVHRHEDQRLFVDLPALPVQHQIDAGPIAEALDQAPLSVWFVRENAGRRFVLAELATADQVANSPVPHLDGVNLMITAAGDDCDFVSRYFGSASGIPEDPVTGSMHATLTPLWSQRLNKSDLHARQLSPRGGELWCHWAGDDRVVVGGHSVTVLRGELLL